MDAYLRLADDVFMGELMEADLPNAAIHLPPLDKHLLDQLSIHAERFSTTKPRYSWAVSYATYHAAVAQHSDLFLQSLAAWGLARACNHWAQPKRVNEALSIARRGFEELNEAGWMSACDWQENALAWSRPNFAVAAQTLNEALENLERNDFGEFIPDCRLALAYAQILIGEHPNALENIRLSEEIYAARGDSINQARCWLQQASSLRRRDRFEEAQQKLEEALAVFVRENAVTDQAKAHYQMALGRLLKVDDLPEAVLQFTKAAELFKAVDLDLWRGFCINNLGSVYLFTGELTLADQYYQEGGEIYSQHEIPGLLADNLNDHGEVNILRGRPQVSVGQFKQAVTINEKLGSHLSAAVSMTNLGKAYGQTGRYQDALFYLEQAAERLKSLNSFLRLGTCEKYAALIWAYLGQFAMAHEHLDQAALNYELAGQKAILSEIQNTRAVAYFQQGRDEEAIACLKESLANSLAHDLRPQTAIARRLLGEALTRTGKHQDALEYLHQAQVDAAEMGMQMETAASLVAIGFCFAALSRQDESRAAFQDSLQLSEGILPEIEWRANAGLGNLAESLSDTESALKAYRLAFHAFAGIRQSFWQAGLAGTYLENPSRIFDGIISFTAGVHAVETALSFIEQTKASTLLGQLLSGDTSVNHSDSQELNDMEAEILFLQDQLRTALDVPLPQRSGSTYRQLRAKLSQKAGQYESLKSRLERLSSPQRLSTTVEYGVFDLAVFRELADRNLQKNWIALDYYFTKDRLTTIILASDRCEVQTVPVSHRFRMALDACKKAGQNPEPPTRGDLEALGRLLIPSSLAEQITPETVLLLSPHKELHSVPWAALYPQFEFQPLVKICVPTVVPSLRSLLVLWQRKGSYKMPRRGNGLVVGLSSFNGRRRNLPYVKDEIYFLSSRLRPGGIYLAENEATWENISELNQTNEGLSRFAWLHVASHFFVHAQTGRLSGLVLSDGDIWLDKLRDLSPLPDLITISACNSLSSFLYEGDEHVDLPSTCLAGGANSVVGSLWPVPDQSAAEFTMAFYRYFLDGRSPARAVVAAQREILERGEQVGQWAGFTCIGVP